MAAQNQERRPLDNSCKYTIFNDRVDGKVPCMAVGDDLRHHFGIEDRELVGVAFQKVNKGHVKPILPRDKFTHVEWTNSPTLPPAQRHPRLFELPTPTAYDEASPKWTDFANFMARAKVFLLQKMTSPEDEEGVTAILDGLEYDYWEGGVYNLISETPASRRLQELMDATQLHWRDWMGDSMRDWTKDCMRGFHGGDICSFKNLLRELVPCITRNYQSNYLIVPPAETSKNKGVENGVLHCLVYGFHNRQNYYERVGQHQSQVRTRDENRSRFRKRVILPKACIDRSRSRSRSKSPEHRIQDDVERINEERPVRLRDVFNNPDSFELSSSKLHHYFESHKPDMVLLSPKDNDTFKVKLVVELANPDRYSTQVPSVGDHVDAVTVQCLQSCVAGLSHNQTQITGLVIVPDGLKLLRIVKEDEQYVVYETNLITWDQTEDIPKVFKEVQNIAEND